jgi:hypothetical protein
VHFPFPHFFDRCISHELFHSIGVACPNLRVLDLSNAIAIAAGTATPRFTRLKKNIF